MLCSTEIFYNSSFYMPGTTAGAQSPNMFKTQVPDLEKLNSRVEVTEIF